VRTQSWIFCICVKYLLKSGEELFLSYFYPLSRLSILSSVPLPPSLYSAVYFLHSFHPCYVMLQ
jgi:hypothetical protein